MRESGIEAVLEAAPATEVSGSARPLASGPRRGLAWHVGAPQGRKAVHLRLHALVSPLSFMGEGPGERAGAHKDASCPPNAARPDPFPEGRGGLSAFHHCLCEQHYHKGGTFSLSKNRCTARCWLEQAGACIGRASILSPPIIALCIPTIFLTPM